VWQPHTVLDFPSAPLPPPLPTTHKHSTSRLQSSGILCYVAWYVGTKVTLTWRWRQDFSLKCPHAGIYLPNYKASQPWKCNHSSHCCEISRYHTHNFVYNAVLWSPLLPVQGTYNVDSRLMLEHSGFLGCDAVLLGKWFAKFQGTTCLTTQRHFQQDLNPELHYCENLKLCVENLHLQNYQT
jgi:hypothetical protein